MDEYNKIYYRVKYNNNRDNKIYYRVKHNNNRVYLAWAIFMSFIDVHLEEDNFICFTVNTSFEQKVYLSTDSPETDYIIFDNQRYAGMQLFDLYRKIHTEAIENSIEELD